MHFVFHIAGIEAKRLWRHNGTHFTSGDNKDVSDEGGTLNVYSADPDRDGGKYECIAVANGVGQDAIKFNGAENQPIVFWPFDRATFHCSSGRATGAERQSGNDLFEL